MMVTPVHSTADAALAKDGAAEFAHEHDERVIEQPARFQVTQQRRGRLIDVAALTAHIVGQTRVMIPAAVKELHKAHVALDHPAREQAVARVRAGLGHFRSVHFQHGFRFLRDIRQLRHAGLHAEGHLLLGDGGGNLRVADLRLMFAVQLGQRIEHAPAHLGIDATGIGKE